MKLILSPEVQTQVDEILAPLINPALWTKMNLSFAKFPYAIVRMEGNPGCGKTALAQYMARRLKQAPLEISFDKVANPMIGETEKAINQLFHTANETETKTIIMEECDALLWSRSFVNEDTTHMLGFINTLLTCIDKFRQREIPSLLILTSNHPEKLDSAMESRITDVIKLFPPVGKLAEKLWSSKLPECLLDANLSQLAALGATPRQIENAILKISRRAIKQNRLPIFQDFELA